MSSSCDWIKADMHTRVSICPMDNGRGMVHHAKVGAFYGGRYTTLVNGGHESCMARCGTNTMKAHSSCPPSPKPSTYPRTKARNSRLSPVMWTDTTYRQIGTCGLQVMDHRWSKASVITRIDFRRRNYATGNRNTRFGPLYNPCFPAGAGAEAEVAARAHESERTDTSQAAHPQTEIAKIHLRHLTRVRQREVRLSVPQFRELQNHRCRPDPRSLGATPSPLPLSLHGPTPKRILLPLRRITQAPHPQYPSLLAHPVLPLIHLLVPIADLLRGHITVKPLLHRITSQRINHHRWSRLIRI